MNVDVPLPADLPPDSYDMLLHLPDAAASLAERPAYAIRLAHRDGSEPASGYNALGAALRVE